MEDLIYIVVGLLWLVFTFYTSSKKRKQKQQQQGKPSPSGQNTPKQNILDELFGKNESFIPKEEASHPYSDNDIVYEDSSVESFQNVDDLTFEDEYESKGINSIETVGNKYYSDADNLSFQEIVKRAQSHRIVDVETANLHIEDHHNKIIKKEFNLRKALIYQAILERPYG